MSPLLTLSLEHRLIGFHLVSQRPLKMLLSHLAVKGELLVEGVTKGDLGRHNTCRRGESVVMDEIHCVLANSCLWGYRGST